MKSFNLCQNLFLFTFLNLLIWNCNGQKGENLLSPENFQFRVKANPNAQVLDVRTPAEFATGHLSKAINLDYYSADFESKLGQLSREKPVFVYCKVGGRSHDAATLMRKMGFKQVLELDGGIMKWTSKDLPLEGQSSKENNRFTEADLAKMVAGKVPVLVDFYAPWCGPCKKMEPMLEKLKGEWSGKIVIQRLNVDDATALCKAMKVESIPVFVLFVDGKEVKRIEGEQTSESLKTWLKEELKK
ncbi:MAG TPA: thioredoxin domain-containing protein [Catalimonadaceae bacterium]|nr:thioredoxin domain-containing protein [Catalimonadaceae bacterium]